MMVHTLNVNRLALPSPKRKQISKMRLSIPSPYVSNILELVQFNLTEPETKSGQFRKYIFTIGSPRRSYIFSMAFDWLSKVGHYLVRRLRPSVAPKWADLSQPPRLVGWVVQGKVTPGPFLGRHTQDENSRLSVDTSFGSS